MSNEIVAAVINLGTHTSVSDDFASSLVIDDHGNQNFLQTLENHIAILKEAINTLELIKDATDKSEAHEVELISTHNVLRVIGNSEIIDRYVGCGVAAYDGEGSDGDSDSDSDSDTDDSDTVSESSGEYNEYQVESDDTDTPIDPFDDDANYIKEISNDNESSSSSSSDEVLIKKKAPKKVVE